MDEKIKHVIVAITNRCNLHCQMCTIWREPDKTDLDVGTFEKIFSSSFLDDNFSLTLTGGEPFLSTEFYKIVDVIVEKNPGALKTISTNGTLTDNIMSFLRNYGAKLPNLSMSISFDGINRHDMQRGRSKSNILETVRLIKSEFPDMKLKLKFTITPFNYEDILPTYDYCKNAGVVLKVKLAESAENYTNKLKEWAPLWSDEMKKKIREDLGILRDKIVDADKEGADFIARTINALDGKYHLKECRAPYERVFVMPNGVAYSCVHMDSIGSLKDSSLDELYLSKKAENNRLVAKEKKCKGCVSFHGSG